MRINIKFPDILNYTKYSLCVYRHKIEVSGKL